MMKYMAYMETETRTWFSFGETPDEALNFLKISFNQNAEKPVTVDQLTNQLGAWIVPVFRGCQNY